MAEKQGYNRRDFLKIIGATTGVAAAGCAKELPEKLIPYVIQPDEVVPGVATWYAASCNECSAGCGVLVRTREGRVTKVEGNPAHPLNRGGLCALGQSSVQSHYDPDRVREPLRRDVNGAFKPISWQEAVDAVAEAMAAASKTNKRTVLITPPLSGSALTLSDEFLGKLQGGERIEYSLLNEDALKVAAREGFGQAVDVDFDFSKAAVIVGVGADYLGTWKSPVRFTKDYRRGRVPSDDGRISKVFHIEPRLSLTAANADTWLMNAPGSEAQILRALCAALAGRGGGRISGAAQLRAAAGGEDAAKLLEGTGLTAEQIDAMAQALVDGPDSLVVAGGPAVSGADGVEVAGLSLLLNSALGNIGRSVMLHRAKTDSEVTTQQAIQQLTERMGAEKSDIAVIMLSGVNPVYAMPEKSGFASALAKAGLVVALANNLDETAKLAHIVLPLSSGFESWGDAEPVPGVFNLNQPSMQPLYKSQSYGDTLLSLAASEKLNLPFEGIGSFHDYIRAQWQKRLGQGNFEQRWLTAVQQGGDWSSPESALGELNFTLPRRQTSSSPRFEGLALLSFPTVHFGDGQAANRPWMQEIPDPISGVVWGSWVEVHPTVLDKLSLKPGQVVQVVTPDGSFEAPALASKYIHPDMVAVPLGQGHLTLGRYSNGVGTNPLRVYPGQSEGPLFSFVRGGIALRRSVASEELVVSQGSDNEFERGFARSISVAALQKSKQNGHGAHHHGGDDHHGEDAHGDNDHGSNVEKPFELAHHDPLALGPGHEPKQMYEQMEHVLYRWGMTIDVAACTGCTACVTACYAENNIPVVGKELFSQGREMSWIRINRFFDGPETKPVTGFVPMLCQHCNNAPCEPVCPVYATYHSDEGLNTMVYNRCVGTRYCSNNCTYKVRRFNWFEYSWPEPLNWQLNPDITTRGVGVMEKCTFCIQRIREVQNVAKNEGRAVHDGEVQPACASSCPADAIRFGNLLDKESEVAKDAVDPRSYKILDVVLNTQPAISYLAKVTHEERAE